MKQYIYRLHGGGDAAEVYYYANGGYDNLPYKKMIKTVGGTGGSFKDDYQEFQIDNSRKYIVSSWMKSNRIESGMAPYALDLNRFADNAYRLGGNINLTTEWQKIYWIYNSGVDHAGSYISRGIVYVDNDLPLSVYWSGFQVEDVTGTDQVLPTSNFSGFIDEPKIYNYTRTSEEIKQDYNAGLAAMSTPKGSSVAIGGDSPAWMSDGLVGHWKMDEASWNGTVGEVIDSSGNGNNGTAAGTALTTTGKFGSGGGFDGESGTYVSLPDNMTDLSGDWAVGGWVKPNSDSNPRIFTLITDSDNLEVGYMSGSLAPYIRIDESTQLASSGLSAGQWQYIIYQMKSGVREIYLNGEKLSLSSGGITTNGMYSAIGGGYDNYQMNGLLDDFRFYSRSLSPEEVKGLYEYAPGPVLHLKMDEKSGTMAYDTSGNENHGNLINEPTWTEGKYGGGLEFDGVDDYLNINNSSQFDSSFSASAWIKVDSNQSSRVGVIGNAEYTDGGWFIGLDYDGYSTKFVLNDDSNEYLITGTEDIRNNWAYISLVFDGNEMFAYLNGKLIDSRSANITKNSNDLFVGRGTQGGWDNFFNGSLDDLKIYNYARTEKQIVEDMNAGHPIGGSPVGSQVAYWKFNEGFGSTAHDSVGDNDGTINSVTWTNDGKFGKALSFDGTDDDVEIKDGALITEDNYSITAFVKLNDLMSSDGVIFSNDNDSGDQIIDSLGIRNGQVAWNYVPAGTYKQGTTTILELNQWYHVVLTSNGGRDGEVKLYINGVEDAITSTGFYRSGSDVRFGARESSGIGTVFFNGFLDEVKIYNYALSENEIKKDYNQGKSLVMGSSGETSSGLTGQAAEYCVPGDTSTCNPPVAEWKFDDKSGTTVYDTSGNGNNGAMINMEDTDWQTSDQCKKGRCMNFNESDEKIALNSPFGKSGYTTVSLWYKRSENHSSGSWRTLVGHTSNIHHLIIHSTSRNLGIWDGGWKDFGYNPPDDGKWHHYEVIYNSGTSATLYVDGVYKNEISTVLNLETYPISTIGNWGGGTYWSGFIDNIKIYDYARTPAQIAWDHNRGKPIAHWKMDEGEGIIVHDESGNGNHGTMQNMSSDDWVDGRNNGALDFDGGDDWGTGGYIIINNPENFNVKEDNSFTLTGWFFIDFDQRGTIFSTGALGGGNGFGCKVFDDYGYLRCEINGSSGGRQDQRNYNLKNEWNFMSWSFDGVSNTSELFLNGKKDIKLFEETGDINYAGGVSVGSVNGNYYFFPGKLDDIQIYNYALTPLQVKNIYNGGAVNYR